MSHVPIFVKKKVSTIAMAAQKDALAVTAGGVLGHAW